MQKRLVVVGVMLVLLASFASMPAVFAAPRSPKSPWLFSVTGAPGAITEITDSRGLALVGQLPGMRQFEIPEIYQKMSHTRYFLVQGLKQADGKYHYPVTVHMAQGVQAAAVEVAEDPGRNVEVIAVGVQAFDTVQPYTATSSANLATVWYDPFNLQLVQVFDYLTWTWTGSSVTGSSARYPATILAPDGWVTISEGHDSNHGTGGAYAETYGVYYNAPFCSGTWANFNPTEVVGLANGTRSYSVDAEKYGNCTSYLHWGAHFN